LPLALAFMIVISLFLAFLLSFVDASLRISTELEGLREEQYAVDGAVDLAIKQFELTGECPETVTLNDVEVELEECSPSGGGGSDNNPTNTPEHAILTLSTGSETGIDVSNNNKTYSVLGDVFSNNSIFVSNLGELHVTGTVTAHECPSDSANRIIATGTKVCNSTEVKPDPGVGNSLYDPMVASPPAAATVPACSGDPVGFSPGTYSSAAALSARTMTSPSCNRTLHFTPGAYYFNFTDTGSVNCSGTNLPRQWCINNGNSNFRIIGGTPTGDGLTCDPAEPGVQFIFGGDSRLKHVAGHASICAEPYSDRQQIAIYGLKPSELKPNPGSPGGAFSPTSGALVIGDGSTANATLTPSQTAAIDLTGYDDFAVPAGGVDKALLRIAHSENPINRVSWIRATVTPPLPGLPASFSNNATGCMVAQGAITPCTVTSLLTVSTALHSDWVDVTNVLADSAKFPPAVKLEIRRTSGGSDSLNAVLDGIWLEVTPAGAFRGQSGCIVDQPYSGPTSARCPLIWTDGSNTELQVFGTVYAPFSALQLKCPNRCSELFRRGIVARALRIEQPGSSSEETAIEIPQDPGGSSATRVLFIAKVNGATRLRSLVEFEMGEPPQVLNWSVVR
jgi:hypothetical protein